jgi:hypothetical protein
MALISGIVLGAAATEGFNVYRQSHDSQIFQERLRCKAAADAYVKEEHSTDPEHVFVNLEKVDYSPARNSCVAEVERDFITEHAHFEVLNVQDLLSGETLFAAKCPKTEGCEVLKWTFVKGAFDYVMNNASEPIELEKEMATYLESKSPPQSAPPSGSPQVEWDQAKPLTSKSPPKSARPSGH